MRKLKQGDYIFIRTRGGLISAIVRGTSRSGLSVLVDDGTGDERFYLVSKCQLQEDWRKENEQ